MTNDLKLSYKNMHDNSQCNDIMTIGSMALSITTVSMTTLSMIMLSKMTFSI
jgi:hypothetical protein